MKRRKSDIFPVCVVLLLVFPAFFAASQDASRAEIVYAEGRDFSLVRSGERTIYSVYDPEVLGLELYEGDLLQTGAESFLEVQLLPKGTVIKIAENSSFQFKNLGKTDETVSLGLVYGRVRAKVARLSGDERFFIRSGATVAGVRGTDFGFDAIINPDSPPDAVNTPAVRVYCFSGELALLPETDKYSIDNDEAVVSVLGNELISVNTDTSIPVVERRAIDIETKKFWVVNDFRGNTPVPPPESAVIQVQAEPEQKDLKNEVVIEYITPDYEPFERLNKAKNRTIAASSLFTALGLGIQSYGMYMLYDGDIDSGKGMILSGTIPLGIGVVTLFTSLFLNPSVTE